MAAQDNSSGLTLTVLGSGTMGIAIMGGVMASLKSPAASNTSRPARVPTKFVACDMRKEAEDTVRKALGHYELPLTTLTNDNVKGVQQADVILLSCKPQGFKGILGEEGMLEALKGKLLVSILAGVTAEAIEEFLYPNGPPKDGVRVVRVMPNTASFVRESTTVISQTTPPLSNEQQELVTFIFSSVGRVFHLPAHLLDVSTALCGSGPAFCALIIEALADGAVAMGMPRAEANQMAAQVMRGTTGLVLEGGEHPAILREKVSTPGGTTIGGLLTLEDGAVRSHVARAVREATVVASALGSGARNVNGPRR